MPIGLPELAILLLILLVIFGPKRLPQMGRSLGGGMREFKDAITGRSKGDDEDDDDANAALGRPGLSHADPADPTRTPTGERDESATRPGH